MESRSATKRSKSNYSINQDLEQSLPSYRADSQEVNTQKSAKKVDFALEPTICKTAGSEMKSGEFGGINTVQDFMNPYTDNTFTNISLNNVIKE